MGLLTLLLVVVGFAVWSVNLVVRAGELRGLVEANVARLQRTAALRQATAAWLAEPAAVAPAPWLRAADEVVAAVAGADDAGGAIAGGLAALERARVAASPEALGELIKDVMDTQGWNTEVKLHHLLGGWASLVGEVNAAHSKPESFADKVLTGAALIMLSVLAALTFWLQSATAPGDEKHDGKFRHDPDAIAESYWQIHRQHRSAWTHELDLRPWMEPW